MIGAALLVLAALSAPAIDAQGRTPDTDETIAVTKGARLVVENFAGEVVIRTWNRDSLRVHGRRIKVSVTPTAAAVRVRSQGAQGSVDYQITVPAWMPLRVVGTFAFIDIEGAQSEVFAETTRGDVLVKGGTGAVTARSIEGDVIVEGASGRITASALNENVRITRSSGDITADSNNGDITMTGVKAQNIEASTINGDISFEGAPADRGRYRFTTHNGNIGVDVPPGSNVSLPPDPHRTSSPAVPVTRSAPEVGALSQPSVTDSENSDVDWSCPAGPSSVAVATMESPAAAIPASAAPNCASPLASVVTVNAPRNVSPSPYPEASAVELAKTSIR